jgi:hypothetical protein
MSRRKSRIPIFIPKKINNEKEEFSPSLQVVFSIVDRSSSFSLFIFFWIKIGILDFLLDIYSAYKSFV